MGIMTFLAGAATADAEKTAGSAAVGVLTNYVWRGQNLGDDGVVQPTLGITYGSFGMNFWSNYDMDTRENNETDLTLNYSTSLDKLTIDFGYIYYALDAAEDTQEIYMTLSYDVLLSPALAVYYDFDEGDGGFVVASVGHTIGISERTSFNLGAAVGINLNNAVMGKDSSGDAFTDFYNGEISVSLDIAIDENLTVSPMAAYSFGLSDDAKNIFEGIDPHGESDVLYGGIDLSLSF